MARRYAVIAEPGLDHADRAWIEALRRRHDPVGQARVGPHLTLFFAAEFADPAPLARAMRREAMRTKPFRIALDHVLLLEDVAGGFVVCLGVTRGRAALVRLHDRLYEGPLAPRLRTDIAFEPHLTLGRRRRIDAANRLAADIAAADPDIHAPVEMLRLVELGAKTAIPGRRFRLRG